MKELRKGRDDPKLEFKYIPPIDYWCVSTVALDNEQIVQYLFLATEQAVICESVIFFSIIPLYTGFWCFMPRSLPKYM